MQSVVTKWKDGLACCTQATWLIILIFGEVRLKPLYVISFEGKLGNPGYFCLIPFIKVYFRSGLSPGILCISVLMEKGRSKWKMSSLVISFKMSANYSGQVTKAEMNTLSLNGKEPSQSRWKPFFVLWLAWCLVMSQDMSSIWRKISNYFS